jgi:8-oxo-dGTP diphosphatase
MIVEFGTRLPGRDYVDRPSVYGIVFDAQGRVLVVEEDDEYYLPGGGIDPGEDVEAGLRRELVEETGYAIEILGGVCSARQYAIDKASGRAWVKLCSFFTIRLVGESKGPSIATNHPHWVTVDEAVKLLKDEAHHWAVRQAFAAQSRQKTE